MKNTINGLKRDILEKYNNIGKKIKKFAIIKAIFMMIGSWICGIGMMFEDDIGGIFIAIIGSFWSFNSMYILYGLGDLIDKVSLIVDNMMIDQNDDNILLNNSVDSNKVDEINCNCKFNICSNKCDNNFMKFFIMIMLLLIVIILLIYLIGNL